MKFPQLRTALLLALLIAGGCDQKKNGPERAAVSGRVTVDGQPIEQGSIGFFPSGSASGMTSGGPIQNGQFSIPLQTGPIVGPNRVQIHAARKTGRQVPAALGQPGQMEEEQVEAIPPRYNSASTLQCEITSGSNQQNFELTSK